MECKKEKNLENCNCTYEPCSGKGICCDCVRYHLRARELPACFFPKDAELPMTALSGILRALCRMAGFKI